MMQERPHLTRLLGVASLVAALALLFRIVAAMTHDAAGSGHCHHGRMDLCRGATSRGRGTAAAIRDTIRSLREECHAAREVIGIDGSSS